jgi:hypothetical protein
LGFRLRPERGDHHLGPYTINVDAADRAAAELSHAIYLAAHELDKRNTAELRVRTVDALTNAGVRCDEPEATVWISSGNDLRIWISLNAAPSDVRTREHTMLAIK